MSSVIEPSNKQLLWEILTNLIEDNDFYIPDINEFKSFLDKTCRHYHIKRFDFDSLSSINKKVIADSFNYLKQVSKSKENLIMFKKYNTSEKKNNSFSETFKKYEENFKNSHNKKNPDEIDFAETVDTPIANMDEELNKRMQSRDNDLHKIVDNYENENSLKWITSGGQQKLRIHDVDFEDTSNKVKLEIQEISHKKSILKDNRTPEMKQKIENQKKKVKFESSFINSIKNNKNGQDIAKQIIQSDLKKNKRKEEKRKRNEELRMLKEIKSGNMQPNELLMKQFELLNNSMNKNMEIEKDNIGEKNKIIKMIDIQEKEGNSDSLSTLFGNMKIKTKNSDVIAATNDVDVIDVNKRIDKLENYLFQIIENQYKILEKFNNQPIQFKVVENFEKEIKVGDNNINSEIQTNETNTNEKIDTEENNIQSTTVEDDVIIGNNENELSYTPI